MAVQLQPAGSVSLIAQCLDSLWPTGVFTQQCKAIPYTSDLTLVASQLQSTLCCEQRMLLVPACRYTKVFVLLYETPQEVLSIDSLVYISS